MHQGIMLKFLNDNATAVQAFAGAAQAVFALVLVFVGVCQIRIYNKIRRDGIVRDRASVFPQIFDAVPGGLATNRNIATFWVFSPKWENTGGTRTVEMINHINIVTFGAVPNVFDFPDLYRGDWSGYAKLLLGPRQTLGGQPLALPVDVLVAAKLGEKRMFLYGWTEYCDLFDRLRLHRTEFCREIMVLGEPNETNCRFGFNITGDFNGADEECYRKAGHRAALVRIDAQSAQESAHDGDSP
jgi:hypothetical protein